MSSLKVLKSLEKLFGYIPPCIEQNMCFVCENNQYNFTCVPCKRIMNSRNLEYHVFTKKHKQCLIPRDTILQYLNETFSGKIPQIVLNNISVLGVDGLDYYCVMCGTTMKVHEHSTKMTEQNFLHHLMTTSHYMTLQKTIRKLEHVYGRVPEFICSNIQFLKLGKSGKDYICMICNVTLSVFFGKLDTTKKIFEGHLFSQRHVKSAKQIKAFTRLSQLEYIFPRLPHYMLRNADYISNNGPNLYCAVCNENIRFNQNDIYETEQNLKAHFIFSDHYEHLRYRRNPNNPVFNRLLQMFERFPQLISVNLEYLTMWKRNLSCNICRSLIYDGIDSDETKRNVINHFYSKYHAAELNREIKRRSDILKDLTNMFGSIPGLIKDNIKDIKYLRKNDFQCVVCDAVVKCTMDSSNYENAVAVAEDHFEKHFIGSKHIRNWGVYKRESEALERKLKNLLGWIPEFIYRNWYYIVCNGYRNYSCKLCDVTIVGENISTMRRVNLQNFKTHLFSADHLFQLKRLAEDEMITTKTLESIYGCIPNFVLNNINYIYRYDGGSFYCRLCAVVLRTKESFYDHLCLNGHKSQAMDVDLRHENALEQLECSVWRIPEFLLRNIDFLSPSGDNLFCLLCQITLPIYNDLYYTKESLRCHIDSEKHQYNWKNICK